MEDNLFKRGLKSFFSLFNSKKEQNHVEASVDPGRFGRLVFSTTFTGEKNLGEAGPIKNWNPGYEVLRARSWDSYLTNEIPHIIINKYGRWVVGKGLKLHSEPNKLLLESEGIKLQKDFINEFSELVEARFETWANSVHCDYAARKKLGKIALTAYKNVKIGGDVLVILRLIGETVKVQLIDGCHVRSPLGFGSETFPQEMKSGNRIINGVEMDDQGRHVAYYVWTDEPLKPLSYERIECYGKKTGLRMAYLISGLEYRLHNVRSLPAITTMLESLAKVDRYKEAALASAEEKAKIAYTIEHQHYSTGENPLLKTIVKASDINSKSNQIPVTDDGNVLADKIAATTNKQAWNMPIGAKLMLHENKGEIHFKDFYDVFFDSFCAAIGAPPEVMRAKYDSNFSSARAAIKDWEHTLNVERDEFSYQFDKPIYDLWLYVEILKNKIQAPGYLKAKLRNDWMIIEAYHKCRFVGVNVPHIDPVKEVNAVRLKLGDSAKDIPLITVQQATEDLNGGESLANLEQYASELTTAKKLKIVPEEMKTPPGT